jgi:hypothetical protein
MKPLLMHMYILVIGQIGYKQEVVHIGFVDEGLVG